MNLAPLIDHTLLRPTLTPADVRQLCDEAALYGFAAVCVPPYSVRDAAEALAGAAPRVATVIGFPFGYSHYSAKVAEVQQALADGATELDMVVNLAAVKNNDAAWLETEISAVVDATAGRAALKLIIETGVLTDEEIVRCCALYSHYPVHFLKTSTGYAESGASVHAVQLLRAHLPSSIKIKASGGIRTYHFAAQLAEAGADRLGCSASIAIVKGGEAAGAAGY